MGEMDFVGRTISLNTLLDTNPYVDLHELRRGLWMCMRLLGPRHWASIKMEQIISESLVARVILGTQPPSREDVKTIMANTDHFIQWSQLRNLHPEEELRGSFVSIGQAMVCGGEFEKALLYFGFAEKWADLFGAPTDLREDIRQGVQTCSQ